MSSSAKKIWKTPEVLNLATAEEAIAYYTERGMSEHVDAVGRLSEEHTRKKGDPPTRETGDAER